jgi:hypothetical protein
MKKGAPRARRSRKNRVSDFSANTALPLQTLPSSRKPMKFCDGLTAPSGPVKDQNFFKNKRLIQSVQSSYLIDHFISKTCILFKFKIG